MQYGRLDAVQPRHGDWGPAYILQGPSSDIGLLTMRPGDEMTNHIHHFCDESFIGLEGEVTLWIDCKEKFTLKVGDVYRCAPGEQHYLINESAAIFRMIFLKSPASPGDTVELPWLPGEIPPAVPATPTN